MAGTIAAPTVAIVTLGCKLNQADSDRLGEAFRAAGFVPVDADQPADAVVVNTCTVTHVADRKSRQALRRARRLNRQAVVAAVGCYPAVSPGEVRALPEVDLVLGTRDKLLVVEQVARRLARPAPTPLDAPAPVPARPLTRAMVKIEEGCDARCTFCIIPAARGDLTSLPMDDIVAQVRALAADHHEVVLTGTNVGRYGYEWGRRRLLPHLLRRVLDETPVRRLRLTSVEPSDLTDELLALWRDEPRLARHFHLALQSGSDPILRAMRRRYNTAQFGRAVERLRSAVPEVAITTDIIGGFPGETEAHHAETLAFARAMAFSRIHVFPYSPRRGTVAARLPDQVADAVRERRCAELRALGAELAAAYHRRWLGRTVEVLWEEAAPEPAVPTGGPSSSRLASRPMVLVTLSGESLVGADTQVRPTAEGGHTGPPLRVGPGGQWPDHVRSDHQPVSGSRAVQPATAQPATASIPGERGTGAGLPGPHPSRLWSGHTDTYIRVVAPAPAELDLTGRATPARLVELDGEAVRGQLVAPGEEEA